MKGLTVTVVRKSELTLNFFQARKRLLNGFRVLREMEGTTGRASGWTNLETIFQFFQPEHFSFFPLFFSREEDCWWDGGLTDKSLIKLLVNSFNQ